MSIIPAGISRAPNLLFSQSSLSNITRANLDLFTAQTQLATGRKVGRFSDDAVKAATISVLDDSIERSGQRARNLDHAESALDVLDSSLGEATDLLLDAKSIASEQVGFGSSAEERASKAQVVGSMLQSLLNLANRQSVAGYMFGGSRTGTAPVEQLFGGFRYVGEGDGLTTDLGLGDSVRLTLGASNSIGATSARVRGDQDLDPVLTGDTRLADMGGARGLGVTPGTVRFSFSGGPLTDVDLSGADSAQDVADALTFAIRDYETAHGVTALGAGGVSFAGGAFTFDVAPGGSLQFADATGGVTAQDLGLVSGSGPVIFTPTSPAGLDAAPELTWRTGIGSLAGVTGPLGSIRLNNMGQSRVVDLSGAATLGDLRNIIEGAGLGLRVVINTDGSGIDVLNEVAGSRGQAMSIEEVPGGTTATALGIRSFTASTRIADFNDGRGVSIVDGATDPITGLPDPALNSDFSITLGDTGGTTFPVDLRPQDMVTVQTVIDRINAEAAAAGIAPADFSAALADGANGIAFTQNAAFTGSIRVGKLNNSAAAEQLGLATGTYDATTRTFRAEDRAKVRVDNLFTQLIDLRDSLLGNDTAGMTIAGERLETSSDALSQTRALVGGYASRVGAEQKRVEDSTVTDEKTRSNLRDLDYAEAASRFALLQTQLQAGIQSAAAASRLSLLDFLG